MLKYLQNKIVVIAGMLSVMIFLGMSQMASAEYKLHEKIPGQGDISTLQQYLEGLYKFGIAIVAILAVVMVAVGAFMYIVTAAGNASKMVNAKEIITNALFGLVMALVAWLILFVINPDLVGGTLDLTAVPLPESLIDDGKADLMQCPNGEATQPYESGFCRGDKICVKNECRSKKSLFKQPNNWLNAECGNLSPVGLVGKCQDQCTANQYEIVGGAQCGGGKHCCTDLSI